MLLPLNNPGRRTFLGAAAGLTPLCSDAGPIPDGDALLLALAADLRAAREQVDASVLLFSRSEGGPNEEAAAQARDAAMAAEERITEHMTTVPAKGMAGLAVKAAVVADTLENGASGAEQDLALSLLADVARLVPGAALA